MQIASYAYLFPDEAGTPRRMLLPLLDLMNHGDPERINIEIMQAENGDFFAYTLRDIRQGEEVRCAALLRRCARRMGWQASQKLAACGEAMQRLGNMPDI